MNQISHHEVPAGFLHCVRRECPIAATCLRARLWATLSSDKEVTSVQVLNPALATATDACPFYRSSAPAVYAFGFQNMQRKMFPQQYDTFRNLLISRLGRTAYFEYRRGNRPLSPQGQQMIRDALKRAGVSADLDFDRYEERINWYD